MEENFYLIPSNVKQRFEFFPGIGMREILIIIISTCIGVGLFFLLGFIFQLFINEVKKGINGYLIIRLFVIIFFTGFPVLLFKEDQRTGFSTYKLIKTFRYYKTRPKRYLYYYGYGRGDK